ncbi:MAG: hypothetical protein CVU59_12900 [Deltaproteobacteria bacterium HGW-Deltaproteobacteria-17]|nr:MAG: hypothetical protein CVU59_12900 [Deltaproteobacteria bacterium HGW-Deltaproteobacteria-17]
MVVTLMVAPAPPTRSAIIGIAMLGPMPAPIMVGSVGRNRSPPASVSSLLVNLMRTGVPWVASIIGPM